MLLINVLKGPSALCGCYWLRELSSTPIRYVGVLIHSSEEPDSFSTLPSRYNVEEPSIVDFTSCMFLTQLFSSKPTAAILDLVFIILCVGHCSKFLTVVPNLFRLITSHLSKRQLKLWHSSEWASQQQLSAYFGVSSKRGSPCPDAHSLTLLLSTLCPTLIPSIPLQTVLLGLRSSLSKSLLIWYLLQAVIALAFCSQDGWSR